MSFHQPPQVLSSFTVHSQHGKYTQCKRFPSKIDFRVVFKKEREETETETLDAGGPTAIIEYV